MRLQADGPTFSLAPKTSSLEPIPYTTVHDLWQRTRVRPATLERLAAADAFRSLGLDRRQALWEVKALGSASDPLPLFAWSETRETGPEPAVTLPQMPIGEHVVIDYQTLRLSLKAHPMALLRGNWAQPSWAEIGDSHLFPSRSRSWTCADSKKVAVPNFRQCPHVVPCDALRGMKDGAGVDVAGLVLVRQRPGSAKGVVFMTLEDETGVANVVVWPKMLERYRKVVMTARLILVRGRIQRHEDIIHVVATRLDDASHLLATLTEEALDCPVPIANADEVARPEPGSARSSGNSAQAPFSSPRMPTSATAREKGACPQFPRPQFPPARHPRSVRIIPKSRDFH